MMILLVVAAIGCAGRTSLPASQTASPQAAPTVPMPAVIESFPRPAASTPRRNVFAFAGRVEDRRPRLSVSTPPPDGQAGAPVLHTEAKIVVPDPPPAYRYLGAFGPQTKPILVYKGNGDGDVVNVALGKP